MPVSCINSIGDYQKNRNKYKQCFISFREVMNMKPDIKKIIQVLISLIEEQEDVEIEYTVEEKEKETA